MKDIELTYGFVYCTFLGTFQCPGEGYQKDPNSCTKFYRCVKEESEKLHAYEFNCGPGTVYSEETSNCVHPADSGRPECEHYSTNEIDTGIHINSNTNCFPKYQFGKYVIIYLSFR